jgi:hypothetical protein
MTDGLFFNQPTDGQPVENPAKQNLFYTDPSVEPSVVTKRNLDSTVAQASPALYAAGVRNGMTREEKNIVENWSKIKVLHEKLMAMPNAQADQQFQQLDPAWQGALQKYYQVDYKFKTSTNTNPDDIGWRQVLGVDNGLSMGDLFKSPFRALMWAGMEYGKAFNTVGNLAQDATINRESFWTRDNGKILDSFNGKMLYDESVASELITKYGGANSFVAMHLLKGDTPGEIIDAWGPNDGEILKAVNSMFNDSENFQKVITDFKRAQLSPGRDVARWVNRTFHIDTEKHGDWFDKGSGALDMAYQIFADPLTYLTLGGSAIVKGAASAEKIAATLKTTGDVAQYLNHAKVAEYFTQWTDHIGRYADALATKDHKAQAEIVNTIRQKFPEFSQDVEINIFAKAGVRDLAGLTEYLAGEGTQHVSRLLRGLTTDMRYAREGAIYARKNRALISGAKQTFSDLFKGKVDYAGLDKAGLDKLAKQMEDNGRISTGVTTHDLIDKQIEETSKRGFQKLMSHLTAKHPGNKPIYVIDGKVTETLNTFRQQAFLALEDKAKADVLAATFLDSNVEQRIAMLRGMHEMIYRRMGVHGTAGGEAKIAEWLDTSFADYNKFGARETLKAHPDSPAFKDHNVTEHNIEGPIYASQFKDAIAAPKFLEASQTVARGKFDTRDRGLIRSIPGMIGGAFNSKAVDNAMNHWTWMTLAPMLGIRTAIDEGFFGLMYLNFGQARELRNAQRWRNVLSAYTAEKSAIGPYKAAVQNIFRTGPTRLIDDATRQAVSKKQYGLIGKGNADTWDAERKARMEIFDMALESKYGKKIPDYQKEWLKEAALLNPTILKQASAVHVAEATGVMKQGIFKHDAIPSELDKVLQEAHLTLNKDFSMESLKSMALTDAYTAMYHQFFTRFNAKPYHFTGPLKETSVDPAKIFIKHHNQATDKFEWEPALDEFMNRFGYQHDGANWVWRKDITDAQKENLKLLVQSTRHFDQYKYISSRIGTDEIATGQALFRFGNDVFNDMYHVFHGGVDNYNHGLVNIFRDSLAMRTVGSMAKVNGPRDYRETVKALTFDEYAKAMNGYLPDGRISTNINFNPQPTNLNDVMRNFGSTAFDWMSRQSDGITRQPLVHMHYIAYRKEYQVFEKQYASNVYKTLADEIKADTSLTPLGRKNALDAAREHAIEQSKHFYAERAMIDAANNVLKYADNPEIRSVFAYNMRTTGRFYRAVEDFYRRIYRLSTENGMGTIARLRLVNQGLSANGAVHTDDNGEQYMVLPMDNIIYGAVNNTLRVLTGNEMDVKQPIFNNLTFKLTAGNPSFQSDAGMPYLSGPIGSLSVLAAKSLLGKFSPTKNLSEDVDNLFLGDMGDNVDFRKSVTPRLVNNLWNMLSPDEKSQQEVSALTQAISYNQANGYGINLDDPKYLKADGSVDEGLLAKDKADYLNNLRISAHNIIVTRTLLGMVLPASVQSKDIADLPDYLKDTGLASMQSSFYEMVDSIKRSHPDVQSPYELALATWMGKNKGKLAYIVSKKDSKIQPMLSFSTQMQDWAISNSGAVSKYGAGALLFAPHTGKFNAGVWNWSRAAGITNNVDIDNYFNMVTMQQHVNAYYAIADEEAAALKTIPFSDPDSRRAVTTEYQDKRRIVKLAVPGLDSYLRSGVDNTDAEDFVNNAFAFANDPSSDAPKEVKKKIVNAYNIYQNFMSVAAQIDAMGMSSPSEVKRQEKDKAIAQIRNIISSDDTKTVEQYFNYGLLKLMTAKSKDANAGLGRNV